MKKPTEQELEAALALVDYVIQFDHPHDRLIYTKEWIKVYHALLPYCNGDDNVDATAARILGQAYRAEHEKNIK